MAEFVEENGEEKGECGGYAGDDAERGSKVCAEQRCDKRHAPVRTDRNSEVAAQL
jgi:hypothetical protein